MEKPNVNRATKKHNMSRNINPREMINQNPSNVKLASHIVLNPYNLIHWL